MSDNTADALVVGGGPAGLSAALYLARFLRSVLVFDSGDGRSTHAQTNHNYLGFPDGIGALDLRANGRKQLERYPHARIVPQHVDSAVREEDGTFTVSCGSVSWHGRVVVLATGVTDSYPEFEGCSSYVGTSVFWCITCDGYENQGRDLVVVGNDDAAAGEALQLRSLSDRVRLLTNADEVGISGSLRRRLDAYGIPLIHDRIASAEGAEGQLQCLVTAGGDRLELDAMFSLQGATPETGLAQALGVDLDGSGYVVIDTEQKTSVEGVYAAGDATCLHSHQVAAAVHEGAQAACAANHHLQPPELKAP
ncbi:MAG TPA: NAD(P)/FAD-dependent oxidoreductase [Mycobacteriales bacterium]|nr:NAD(P)/FAD-dependent oxidoreductase [Mycobacteriales bacterium]